MKFDTDIHVSQKTIPDEFGDHITFFQHPVKPTCGFEGNISTSIGWITKNFGTENHVSLRIKFSIFC